MPALIFVVPLRPANCAGVLEAVVDVLKRNKGAIANIAEWANVDRRQGVGERTETVHVRGKADGLMGIDAEVERKGEIVDASEGCPEVEQEIRAEDVRVAQGILLGHVGCGTVEVESAAVDLQTIHNSKIRRRINTVIGEASEDQVPIIEPMVDASVVGVAVLCLVRADREIVAEYGRISIRGRRKQLQVVQCYRINRKASRAVARRQQRLGRPAVDTVDVIVLSYVWYGAGVGDAGD
jgi:hypothetical protein